MKVEPDVVKDETPGDFDGRASLIEWSPVGVPVVSVGFAPDFIQRLGTWLASLRWSISTDDEKVFDISWLELFWRWIWDTRWLAPVQVGDQWCMIDDCPEVAACMPTVDVLLATWRRGVFALRGAGLLPGWGAVSCTGSGAALGSAFSLAGLTGRVSLCEEVCADLVAQLVGARRLASLRLPSFWHM